MIQFMLNNFFITHSNNNKMYLVPFDYYFYIDLILYLASNTSTPFTTIIHPANITLRVDRIRPPPDIHPYPVQFEVSQKIFLIKFEFPYLLITNKKIFQHLLKYLFMLCWYEV